MTHHPTHAAAWSFWRSIDWTRQNSVIARETGYSEPQVRYCRQKLGMGESPAHRQHPTRLATFLLAACAAELTGHLTYRQIGAELGGVSRQRVFQWLQFARENDLP